MNNAEGEHFDMHQLVFRIIIEFGQTHAVFVLKYLLSLLRLARHPIPDDGVHRVICTAAVDTDPA